MEIISPEKPKISIENNLRINSKSVSVSVSVLYYISRNGHLDHPHFMEVPLSSSHGLYLRGNLITPFHIDRHMIYTYIYQICLCVRETLNDFWVFFLLLFRCDKQIKLSQR